MVLYFESYKVIPKRSCLVRGLWLFWGGQERLVVDMIRHWAIEHRMDGFRFEPQRKKLYL